MNANIELLSHSVKAEDALKHRRRISEDGEVEHGVLFCVAQHFAAVFKKMFYNILCIYTTVDMQHKI